MHLPSAINIVVTNVETLFHRLSNRNSDRIIKYLLQFDMSRRIVKVEHLAQNRMQNFKQLTKNNDGPDEKRDRERERERDHNINLQAMYMYLIPENHKLFCNAKKKKSFRIKGIKGS